MKPWIIVVMVAVAFLLSGCGQEAQQARGFSLPEGNAKEGQDAFVKLSCHTCHTVTGVELPKPESPGKHQVVLGGAVYKVKTYGDLVTAVIHPSHDIAHSIKSAEAAAAKAENAPAGELSPMPDFTQTMTVDQMIDIVTFLHGRYSERLEDYDFYPLGF